MLVSILSEALTYERRLSLSGVGLVKWLVKIPSDLALPQAIRHRPWKFTDDESHRLLVYLLDELRLHRAMSLPEGAGAPLWHDVSTRPQQAYSLGKPRTRKNVLDWGGDKSAIVEHFLPRLIQDDRMSDEEKRAASIYLMQNVWDELRNRDRSMVTRTIRFFCPVPRTGRFGLTRDGCVLKSQTLGMYGSAIHVLV